MHNNSSVTVHGVTLQSQMGKRILKIPKHYAILLPRVTLQLPSMRVRILITMFATEKVSCDFVGETTAQFEQQRRRRSIQCLGKNRLFTVAIDTRLSPSVFFCESLGTRLSTLGPTTFWTLVMCNVDDISLVQQCQWLESHFTHDTTTGRCPEEATFIVHKAELDLLKRDKNLTLTKASKHPSLKHILNIKCWLCVWDKALGRGCAGTVGIQKLIRYLATPVFNDKCQFCTKSINPTVACAEHLQVPPHSLS